MQNMFMANLLTILQCLHFTTSDLNEIYLSTTENSTSDMELPLAN